MLDLKVPWGIQFLRLFKVYPRSREQRIFLYRVTTLFLTFMCYTFFHMSRKAISVVKNEFLKCNKTEVNNTVVHMCTSWITEMDGQPEEEAKRLEGTLDSTFLFSYAFFMFFSGIVAERMNLRYFLSLGMILSAVFVFLFGLAYYLEIHGIAYFIAIQLFGGAFQTTGWPGVVTVVANWFGKGKKGLIFGIWNSHTSVGNILGSILAGAFVEDNWGLSFIVPSIIIAVGGFILWLFLVPKPDDVDLRLDEHPHHHHHHHDVAASNSRRLENRSEDSGELTPLLQSSDESEVELPATDPPNYTEKPPSPVPNEVISPVSTTEVNRRDSTPPRPPPVENEGVEYPNQGTDEEEHAISFLGALKIPGVVEFALCLFFAKLVSYTFLYWLPTFILETGTHMTSEDAAYFSTLFDVGGIVGGIFAGLISDSTGKSASTCAGMLIAAIPALFIYYSFGHSCPLDNGTKDGCYYGNIGFLLLGGLLVNGPYALITTAVSAELGVHPSLMGSSKALATVTSIIDGTGSIGAAIGPFLAGALQAYGLDYVFYMLMVSDVFALLLLSRLVYGDVQKILEGRRQRRRSQMYEQHP